MMTYRVAGLSWVKKATSPLKKARKHHKSQIQDENATTLLNTHAGCTALLKDNVIYIQNETHSINERLENFGLANEQAETVKLKAWNSKYKN